MVPFVKTVIFFCFANITSTLKEIIIIIINPGHFMQTAEWTLEYSAFVYIKQQKHRGYMVI